MTPQKSNSPSLPLSSFGRVRLSLMASRERGSISTRRGGGLGSFSGLVRGLPNLRGMALSNSISSEVSTQKRPIIRPMPCALHSCLIRCGVTFNRLAASSVETISIGSLYKMFSSVKMFCLTKTFYLLYFWIPQPTRMRRNDRLHHSTCLGYSFIPGPV